MKKNIWHWLEKERKKKDKSYTHFDRRPNLLESILNKSPETFFQDFFSIENVSKRAFWPLIHFTKSENRYKKNSINSWKIWLFESKNREIFYASHFDSFIYSYYSYIIGEKYKDLLDELNICNQVLAYRKIELEENQWWKNNIHFASDIFKEIHNKQDCYVFAFDISSFFDNLNWKILEKNICTVLWVKNLSTDWKNIFNSITNYSYIEHEDIKNYNLKKDKVINTKRFHTARKKYKKENFWKKLVKKTQFYSEKFWIAQWTSISWVIANIYMLNFDSEINNYADSYGGKYYRYSDDILLVIPYTSSNKKRIFVEVQKNVLKNIKDLKLIIQEKKTDIFDFNSWFLKDSFTYNQSTLKFEKDKNTRLLSYLGFSFNWESVLIKDKTLSTHYRRMTKSIRRLARLKPKKNNLWIIVRKSRIKWNKILLGKINIRYSHSWAKDITNKYWNFYWYIKASSKIMTQLQKEIWMRNKITNQVSKYEKNYKEIIDTKIHGIKRNKWKKR